MIEDILENNTGTKIDKAYKSWYGEYNDVELYTGKYNKMDYILIIIGFVKEIVHQMILMNNLNIILKYIIITIIRLW